SNRSIGRPQNTAMTGPERSGAPLAPRMSSCRVPEYSRHGVTQFLHGVVFQLADTLGRHTVLIGEILQRCLVVLQPATLDDRTAAVIQCLQCREHALLVL